MPGLGPGGRQFESGHPDEKGFNPTLKRLPEKAAFLFIFKFQIKIMCRIYSGKSPK